MMQRNLRCALVLACLVAAPAAAQSTITCGPLDNGRVADVFYKSNAVFFDPVVEYEYELAVLTVAGPCETLTKTFKPGEEIFFDLAEVERTLDGQYEWELRFMPAVDPGVREELQASRGSGEEDDVWWSFWQKGAIPDGPRVDNAGFTVVKGSIIDPNSGEERQKSSTVATKGASAPLAAATAGFDASGGTSSQEASGAGEGGNVLATKDFVINDDLIVIGSQCLGFDCINGEVFNFDTLRLKENNLRIKFQDTSGGSFPTRDWEIEANSSANGGQTHFRINDVDAGRSPFTVEGSSPSHSLYVDSSGRVGFGTSNPIVELHAASGDTPTLRLDQNTSQGFASQVWDVAGNETSFFIRDATGGSTLPFRIRPGASSNSLVIDSDNDVGVGTLSPSSALHVRRTNGSAQIQIEEASGTSSGRVLLLMRNNGAVRFNFENSATGVAWQHQLDGSGNFDINEGAGGQFELQQDGDLTISGTLTTGGPSCGTGCDRVFSPDYELPSIEEHATAMWANSYLPAVGPTPEGAPFNVSEKTGGILNELEKAHIYIEQLHRRLEDRDEEHARLEERLEEVEALLQAAVQD